MLSALRRTCHRRAICGASGARRLRNSMVGNSWGLSQGELVAEEVLSSGTHPPLVTCRALLLDVSYRPVDILSWQRAIMLSLLAKAEVLEWHDGISVRSARESHHVPAVLKVGIFLGNAFGPLHATRRNVMDRDDWTCQYCAGPANTIDHVTPISRSGKWVWTNLVAACSRCNSRKADKTPTEAGMRLKRMPIAPSGYGLAIRRLHLGQNAPPQWAVYLREP